MTEQTKDRILLVLASLGGVVMGYLVFLFLIYICNL